MKVKIYDTHVHTSNGNYYHFDVVVKEATQEEVQMYAMKYLSSLGVTDYDIKQKRCLYCHEEILDENLHDTIIKDKHFIIPMEGCQ